MEQALTSAFAPSGVYGTLWYDSFVATGGCKRVSKLPDGGVSGDTAVSQVTLIAYPWNRLLGYP
ncbi:hypothetical protein B5180_36030 [Streptomyces sp. BF-3]|nr:hypothetical protein B5180_36030 [Streptomyces sp. BF-3]